jgi:hypothetical protein
MDNNRGGRIMANNKRLKIKIKTILQGNKEMTLGEIMESLRNIPSKGQHSKITRPCTRTYSTYEVAGTLSKWPLVKKTGHCKKAKQAIWKLKEE